MPSITDMIISAVLKKGILGELKNFKTEIAIPKDSPNQSQTKIIVTADNLQIKIEKDG